MKIVNCPVCNTEKKVDISDYSEGDSFNAQCINPRCEFEFSCYIENGYAMVMSCDEMVNAGMKLELTETIEEE